MLCQSIMDRNRTSFSSTHRTEFPGSQLARLTKSMRTKTGGVSKFLRLRAKATRAHVSSKHTQITGAGAHRRVSVGFNENWPTDEDVGNEAPPLVSGDALDLLEELRYADDGDMPAYSRKRDSLPSLFPSSRRTSVSTDNYCDSRVHLPTGAELSELPNALSAHLLDVSFKTMKRLLAPKILLTLRRGVKRRIYAERAPGVARVPIEHIEKMALFRSWPSEVLAAVADSMKLHCYEPHEMIVYEREPAGAIVFIVNGAVQLVRRGGKVPKAQTGKASRTGDDAVGIAQQALYAPQVFGEFSLLTNEPWQHSIRCVGKVDAWVLFKNDFQTQMMRVPPHVTSHTIRTAFLRRNDSMRTNFPMTIENLKQYRLFSQISDEFAGDLLIRLEPHAVPANYVLCREGEPAVALFFLVQGHVLQTSQIGDEEREATTLGPGNVVGATALVQSSSHDATFRTVTDSDLYQLSQSAFDALVRQHPLDLEPMLDAARCERQQELTMNSAHFAELVRQIPILNRHLKPYYVKEFVQMLHPKSYRPLTSICSVSCFCDRLLILTKGKIRLGLSDDEDSISGIMEIGECIGWTCVIPHRWGRGAITMNSTVEALELNCRDFMDFLESKGILNQMIRDTKVLLFPRAFPKVRVEAIRASIPPHIPMYPTGKSRVVNLNEIGFCTIHMHLLEDLKKDERERKKEIEFDTPPAYKQLSNGLWIPKTRYIRGFSVRH